MSSTVEATLSDEAHEATLAGAFGFDREALVANRAGRALRKQLAPLWGALAALLVTGGLLGFSALAALGSGSRVAAAGLAAVACLCVYKIFWSLRLVARGVQTLVGPVQFIRWEGSARAGKTARVRVAGVELSTTAAYGKGFGGELEHVLIPGASYRVHCLVRSGRGELLSIEPS